MENSDAIIFEKCAYIPGVNAAIVFSNKELFEIPKEPTIKLDDARTVKHKNEDVTLGIVQNGTSNNLPNEIKEAIDKNPVAQSCLDFLIDMTLGDGVKYGRFELNQDNGELKFIERKDITEINEFFSNNNIQNLFDEADTDLEWWNKVYIELITDRQDPAKRKIKYINFKDYMFSRDEEMNPNTGRSENHYYSARWIEGIRSKNDYEITPMLDPKNPLRDLKIRMGRIENDKGKTVDEQKYRYVFNLRLPTPGHPYYPRAAWWSIVDSGWIEFSNKIPEFKKYLMQNQISVKHIIYINDQYFPKIFAREGLKSEEEKEARIKKEYEDFKKFLTDTKNTGNSMVSYYKTTPDGKIEIKDVKIESIKNELNGGEYIEDSHEASAMTYTAFQVHPTLVGIIPGKTASNISGSDKWALIKIAQARTKRKRRKLLDILYLVKEINKWPSDIDFHIPDSYISGENPRQVIKPTNAQTE